MVITEVQFRLVGGANPLILVPTFVNGKGPYEFILDTGAGPSLVTTELAAALGIHAPETKEATGAGGRVSVQMGSADSVAVGDARMENVPVAVTAELQRIGAAIGAKIDGDLGHSFLRNFRLTIDYRRKSLRLDESGRGPRSAAEVRPIAFELASPAKPLILLPVFVNGSGPFQFALDTGASSTVISREVANRVGMARRQAAPVTGGGGKVSVSSGQADSIKVGARTLESLDVVCGDFLSVLSTMAGAKLDGILGYNFLREFVVTIDYPEKRLLLEDT